MRADFNDMLSSEGVKSTDQACLTKMDAKQQQNLLKRNGLIFEGKSISMLNFCSLVKITFTNCDF